MSGPRLIAAAAALVACLLLSAPAHAAKARPAVVGGTPIAITAAPWQVYVYAEHLRAGCGGSVLDARRVLTAAHCVMQGTTPIPPASITVLAGVSDFKTWTPGEPAPSGAQTVKASALRSHPQYTPAPFVADDVAVVTLASALDLSTPRTKAIGLAPVGPPPAAGSALVATGYGTQAPAGQPDGKLYSVTLGAVADSDCLRTIVANQTAGVQCATGATGATCYGDSGGPLTLNGALFGVTSATGGATPCAAGAPGIYADLTAPEIRAFVDGSDAPPIAPRLASDATISTLTTPVVGSPITCNPGGWSGEPLIGFAFVDDATGAGLAAGQVFAPGAPHVGKPVSCVVSASNAGGTSSTRTGAAPAIQPDAVRPEGVVRSARCRKRRCVVRFQAADPNSLGTLQLRVTAERRVRGWCRKGKGRDRRRVRCTKVRAKRFAVRHREGVNYVATARKVRRGRATIRLRVRDAAGNRAKGRYLARKVRVR